MESAQPAERGIDSIAHLFLSQATRARADRRPPGAHLYPPPDELEVRDDPECRAVESIAGPVHADELADELETGAVDPPDGVDVAAGLGDAGVEEVGPGPAVDASPVAAVVLTSCLPDDIVAAYQTIKCLVTQRQLEQGLAVFVCEAQDRDTAENVFRRLQRTAREFLEVELSFVGCQGAAQPLRGGNGAAIDLMDWLRRRGRQDRYVFLTEQTLAATDARPLDAERDTLTSGPPVRQLIPIERLPRSDRELLDTLQLQLPRWMSGREGLVVLPVVMPEACDPGVRLLVDDLGAIFVLFGSLTAADGLVERAEAARRWVADHLNTIAETFPVVDIDRAQPPGLLLAVNADDADQIAAYAFDEFPVRLLHLHVVEAVGGLGLLVI